MRQEQGTCKYCKQMRIVKVGDDKHYTQKELDEIASSECNCEEARAAHQLEQLIGMAANNIMALGIIDKTVEKEILGDLRKIMTGERQKLSLTDGSGVTYTLTNAGAKGPKLKVEERILTVITAAGTETIRPEEWRDQ